MYAVTWLFEDTTQQRNYKDILAAERKARELRRFGCRQVKIIQFEQSKKKSVDKAKTVTNTKEAWAAIDAATKQQNESDSEMNLDVTEASELAKELWERRSHTKSDIVKVLNEKFEPTFFAMVDGIYAVNEPDYLPSVLVLSCKGRE